MWKLSGSLEVRVLAPPVNFLLDPLFQDLMFFVVYLLRAGIDLVQEMTSQTLVITNVCEVISCTRSIPHTTITIPHTPIIIEVCGIDISVQCHMKNLYILFRYRILRVRF